MSNNFRAHNPKNYRATSKMQVWLWPKDSIDPAERISLGNIVSFSHNVQNKILEHFSNYLDQRAKDREIITERMLSLDLVIDELSMPNLKLIHGFGFGAASSTTKDKFFDRTEKNPQGGGTPINLGKTGIKNVIVRSVDLDDDVTYVLDTLTTDSTEDTQSNDFNNVTSPLTVAAAVTTYGGITFAVGQYLKIGNEILKVTAISGNDVTFARGQLGTTTAVHANGVSIFIGSGGDYLTDLTNGKVAPVLDGDLDDVDVTSMHIYFEQAVNVDTFEMFPGDTIECEAQVQFDEDFEGPFQGCFLKNNGPIDLGDGSDIRKVSMTLEITIDADGTFGDYAKETA